MNERSVRTLAQLAVGTALTVFLVGCGASSPEPVDSDTESTDIEQVEPGFEIGLSEVYYIKYLDGTRCVLMDRDNGGAGVDCEFAPAP